MLRPPKTNDPALNRFLEEVASTIQDRVRPEAGWTLSDFASSVSEVISDKRDLIDIVTRYDNIEGLSEKMKSEVDRLKKEVQDSMALLSSIKSKTAEFTEVMEWWDQNYKVIFSAREAMEIFNKISAALEGHQDILNQITAATEVAENVVAEVKAAEESAKAAEEAAKNSETNAADSAAAAKASESAAGQSASSAEGSATAAAGSAKEAEASKKSAAGSASQAKQDADFIRGPGLAAIMEKDNSINAAADRAEAAAAGVDQVVSDAAGVLSGEIADDVEASKAARSGAEAARDQAVASAEAAAADAAEVDEARAFVNAVHESLLPDGATTVLLKSVVNRADQSRAAAAESATAAQGSATDARGHADRAATEAGAAAQIAAQEKIAALVGDAPEQLDTIYELAAAFKERGDAVEAIKATLANRVVGNHSSVISSTVPGADTPSNQVTFVVEGA